MYSKDIRCKAVIHYLHFKKSIRKFASLYKISKTTLQRWIHQRIWVEKIIRKSKLINAKVIEFIEDSISKNPFVTMNSISKGLLESLPEYDKTSKTIGRYVRKLGWTRKRAVRNVKKQYDLNTVISFCESLSKSQNIVCIDEAGFYVGETCHYGYAKKGKKLVVKTDSKIRCRKYTLIMAISKDGIVGHQILDTNCKKVDFIRFIESLQVPKNTTLLMTLTVYPAMRLVLLKRFQNMLEIIFAIYLLF